MILEVMRGGRGVHPKDIGKSVRVVGLRSPVESESYTVLIEPLQGRRYYTKGTTQDFGIDNWVCPETFGLSFGETREKYVEWIASEEEESRIGNGATGGAMILPIRISGWGVHPKDVGKSVKVVSVGPPTRAGGYTVLVEPLEGETYYTLRELGGFGDDEYVGPETFDMSIEEIQDKLSERKGSCHSAVSFLKQAIELQEERGRDYDSPEGERSMGKTVEAFNAITGKTLSEAEGWLLLQLLKDVRQWSVKGRYHKDSAEDCVSYAALKAEALSKQV